MDDYDGYDPGEVVVGVIMLLLMVGALVAVGLGGG